MLEDRRIMPTSAPRGSSAPRSVAAAVLAAIVAAAAGSALDGAAATASPTASAECSRPADGRRNAVECRVAVPGVPDGTKFSYAFVRKGCYHPGAAVSRAGEILVRRSDIGNGSWHLSLKPKQPGRGAALRFAFSLTRS